MASLNHYSWLSSPLTEAPSFFPSPSSQPKSWKLPLSRNQSSPDSDSSSPAEPSPSSDVGAAVDPVKLALKRAESYKKAKAEQEDRERNAGAGNGGEEVPVSIKIAMQKATEYKKNKVVFGSGGENGRNEAEPSSSENSYDVSPNEVVDNKKQELKVSSIDFLGLGFADKKSTRGLPPGLVPIVDSFPVGDLPEVEIIVGDKRKFEEAEMPLPAEPEQVGEENSDVYKPKVSTWGVFPRPSNISKTFGGGKNIRPGDSLETAEEKAAKEEKTRRLIAAYKEQIGLNVDPKLKLECEEALETGNSFMDSGKLKEALPYYEKVMEKMVFKSELHGLAALQWSICQDSLRKSEKARVMYEKLQSHPNPNVSKKARQFMFSFQAMEIMKLRGSSLSPRNTLYQNYFEAFIKDKINYASQDNDAEDTGIKQTLPYVIFLVSPILLVFIVAVQRGNMN
ncbi:PREDICTED: uncharacterized protein LOC104824183 [Tarenaya hassleriana]|uniref:uncharacterized protein LOC104824183 n=1 Tax=Tarenaya hassleriana TaxID=28532 RepID=UPI00053C14D6|nr:PREDICTED: uncharacterized protein LOC104824183 [Tarenaya hassleriana]